MATTYRIHKELKTPWIGKPYIEFQIIKEWEEFVMDWPDNFGDDKQFNRVIFKSVDRELVEKFIAELNEEK